ncbi:hypothetical protein G9A89_008238 [Geosiphon pyriformis]|nr:hypothetical protein G9A89_008238 [Geosiphon pyriformis]
MSSLVWKIATCNVRGMNVPIKQEDIVRWHTILNNDISIITKTKLRSSVKPWITNKFPGVRMFTSSLDVGFLGASVALIMNENLAKDVSKISEILARTCNESTFVILDGDFNKDGNKRSSSFSKCVDLGLVNALVNSFYIKTSIWSNSRGIERTIDFVFVSQSLSNALINRRVVNVDEFFNTDHSSVQITIGLGKILDPVLRAIHVQANRDKWKFNVKNADRVKWKSVLAKIKKYYHLLKMIESKCVRDFQIKLAIDKKMENFGLNKGQIIRSVLERLFCKVTLDYLVVNENLILEPGLVKFHVDRIMKG